MNIQISLYPACTSCSWNWNRNRIIVLLLIFCFRIMSEKLYEIFVIFALGSQSDYKVIPISISLARRTCWYEMLQTAAVVLLQTLFFLICWIARGHQMSKSVQQLRNCQAQVQSQIQVPNQSPKSKSQIKVPNQGPKSQIQSPEERN